MKEYIEKDTALETTYKPFTMSMCMTVPECNGMNRAREMIFKQLRDIPAADVVEVDAVFEMLDYTLGNCPCNYSPTDEWLPKVCELQDECPNPKEKYGCWRQFIKHFRSRKMDGGVNDAAD